MATLLSRVARLERQYRHMARMCLHCGGGGGRPPPLNTNLPLPAVHGGAAVGASAAATRQPAGSASSGGGSGRVRAGPPHLLNEHNAAYGGIVCDSLDCGIYFERRKLTNELGTMGILSAYAGDLWQ